MLPPDRTPYRHTFGVCPACGGGLEPPDWGDPNWLRRDGRRCSACRRVVVPAQEGRIIEEPPPRRVALLGMRELAREAARQRKADHQRALESIGGEGLEEDGDGYAERA